MSDTDQRVIDTQILRKRLDSADSQLARSLVRCWQASQAVWTSAPGTEIFDPADQVRRARTLCQTVTGMGESADIILRAWRSLMGDQLAQTLDGPLLAASLDEAQTTALKDYFGTGPKVETLPSARSVLGELASGRRTAACLPWPGDSGQRRWWALLNESAHHQIRIRGAWPLEAPRIALVSCGAPCPSGNDTMLAIAHDDLCQADGAFATVGLDACVLARLRSLVLCRINGYVDQNDHRLAAAGPLGLDRLRLIGVAQKP